MNEFEMALLGWRLTSAKIFYHLPDHPKLLNWLLWQHTDRAPDFPRLNSFLDFWEQNIEGKIHSVQIAVVGLIQPTDLKHVGGEFRLS